MGAIDRCALCSHKLTANTLQHCWYCLGSLCITCSDRFGVCGCPGSYQAQWELVKALIDYEYGTGASSKKVRR